MLVIRGAYIRGAYIRGAYIRGDYIRNFTVYLYLKAAMEVFTPYKLGTNILPYYIKETHSQFKTAFYEWKIKGYADSTLTFALNMFLMKIISEIQNSVL